jgi:hypothetical protein
MSVVLQYKKIEQNKSLSGRNREFRDLPLSRFQNRTGYVYNTLALTLFHQQTHFTFTRRTTFMSISTYYKERNALMKRLEQERQTLLAAGVSEADIFDAHFGDKDSDYELWKADRIYALHNPVSASELSDDTLSLFRARYEGTSSGEPEVGNWFDQIENPKLVAALKTLTPDEFAMVEACWINGVSQEDYAKSIRRKQSSVSERLGRIKKKIKKFF